MKIPSSALVFRTVVVCLSLMVSGCVSPAEPLSSAVFTPTPMATSTQRATPMPSPTSTTLPTATPIPTKTLTPTPVPILPADQAQALVLDLLRNNAGCRLPCWWGFTPGQTLWQTAQGFLEKFDSEIYVSSPSQPLFFANVVIPVPKEIHPVYLTHTYTVRDGIVEGIEVQLGVVPSYGLAEFLKTYGSPAEVWLRTYNQAREGDLQFDVVLFYPHQGILARYATQGQAVGSQIRGCPQQKPAAILVLWSPERELTFSEATSQTIDIRNEEWWPYRPLQEATGMDVAAFYQTFQSSNNAACLKTPADLWPQP